MARKYIDSISKDQSLNEQQKESQRKKLDGFRRGIRAQLANNQTLTYEQKVDLIVDYIVGGE